MPFGFNAPKTLNYLAFQSFDFWFWVYLMNGYARNASCALNLISTFLSDTLIETSACAYIPLFLTGTMSTINHRPHKYMLICILYSSDTSCCQKRLLVYCEKCTLICGGPIIWYNMLSKSSADILWHLYTNLSSYKLDYYVVN